jgi:hypothetical protein
MAIRLNHTIAAAHDKKTAAKFLTEILGLPAPSLVGPFTVARVSDDTSLDYIDADGEITSQHYAFLVDESEFDEIFQRIRDEASRTGPTPDARSAGRPTPGMAGAGSISTIQTAIFWRSSPVRTAAVVRRRPGLTPCLHGQRVPNIARAIDMLIIDGGRKMN